MNPTERANKYFWPKVAKGDGCWTWTAATAGQSQYGWTWKGHFGETYAHRTSWVIHNGPIPEGMFVLHTCDQPLCVRPDHLWLGTPAQNTHDMLAKRRQRKSKVPLDEIARWTILRDAGMSYQKIAKTSRWSTMKVWTALNRPSDGTLPDQLGA